MPIQLDGELTITDNQTSVKGKVTKEATVQLFVGDKPIESAVKTDASGDFCILIKKQKIGTKITIKMKNYAYPANEGEETVTVIDNTKPVVSKVDTVYHTSKNITGKVAVAFKGLPTVGFINTAEDSSFTVPLSASWSLTKGQTITITAKDMVDNKNNYKFKVLQ